MDKFEEVRFRFAQAEAIEPLDAPPHNPAAPHDESSDGQDPPFGGVPPHLICEASGWRENDTDNGRRLLHYFGDAALHVREKGWHYWCGTHWNENGEEAVTRFAQEVSRRIEWEAFFLRLTKVEKDIVERARELGAQEEHSEDEKKLIDRAAKIQVKLGKAKGRRLTFARSSGNAARVKAMVQMAGPHRTIGIDQLNRDKYAFNVENGTLRFSRAIDPDDPGDMNPAWRFSLRLEPHEPDDLISKLAPVAYDPKAKAPMWDAFLSRFQPDAAIRRFLQVYYGYGLLGHAGEQIFVFNYGTGANGKSTFVETIARLFGDYARSIDPSSLTGSNQRRGDQASPDIARLADARLVTVEELPKGEQIRENLVKMLTSGDIRVTARFLNKEIFEFFPVFKATMTGNDKPEIRNIDEGIWRRTKIVPWEVMIPKEERRPMPEILAEFDAERPGILNWLLEGLKIYMEEGMKANIPPSVERYTDEYRQDMDPVGEFIADCFLEDLDARIKAREAFEAYKNWCWANSKRAFTETTFGKTMTAKQFQRAKINGVMHYLGFRLHNVPDGPSDGHR